MRQWRRLELLLEKVAEMKSVEMAGIKDINENCQHDQLHLLSF